MEPHCLGNPTGIGLVHNTDNSKWVQQVLRSAKEIPSSEGGGHE
jgi:hypothetical protein